MKKTIASVVAGLLAVAAFAVPQIASASLVYDSSIHASAQGFGNAPRDLTLQATGQTAFESGSVSVSSSGTIVFGNAITDSQVYMGNSVDNSNSTASMPNPLADNQKYGIPTAGSLGITSADQIAVLFNSADPAGNSINVTDITLKFFSPTGDFLGAIDGQYSFPDSFAGNGVAGFTFVVDLAQQAYVNSLLTVNGANTIFALEASIESFNGGPESFLIYKLGSEGPVPPTSVPEPGSVALLGLGIFGLAASRRKAAKSKNA